MDPMDEQMRTCVIYIQIQWLRNPKITINFSSQILEVEDVVKSVTVWEISITGYLMAKIKK